MNIINKVQFGKKMLHGKLAETINTPFFFFFFFLSLNCPCGELAVTSLTCQPSQGDLLATITGNGTLTSCIDWCSRFIWTTSWMRCLEFWCPARRALSLVNFWQRASSSMQVYRNRYENTLLTWLVSPHGNSLMCELHEYTLKADAIG